MRQVAILGKQNPLSFREYMKSELEKNGFKADILDMQTRNFLDFADKLLPYDAVISCGEKIPAEAVEILSEGKTKLISRWGVGTDEIDKQKASECGIAVCNAAGSLSVAVAECAIAMMINLLREFPMRDASVRKGDWSWFFEGKVSRQLEGKTVGLYGFGDIAKALAKMLYGFDCNVIATDVNWDEEAAKKYNVTRVDRETLIRESDVLSLHVPALPSLVGTVNAEFLSKMKRTAILINTARGKLVNEKDLAYALKNGIIAAAGLDVFCPEPPEPDNPLLKLDNVMLLPHAGAGSSECLEKSSAMAVNNIVRFFDETQREKLGTILNKDYIKNYKE